MKSTNAIMLIIIAIISFLTFWMYLQYVFVVEFKMPFFANGANIMPSLEFAAVGLLCAAVVGVLTSKRVLLQIYGYAASYLLFVTYFMIEMSRMRGSSGGALSAQFIFDILFRPLLCYGLAFFLGPWLSDLILGKKQKA